MGQYRKVQITLLTDRKPEEFQDDFYHFFEAAEVSDTFIVRYYTATVKDYFRMVLGVDPTDPYHYNDFPVASVCGQACVEIIDKGKAAMDVMDSSAHGELLAAVNHACEVICYG